MLRRLRIRESDRREVASVHLSRLRCRDGCDGWPDPRLGRFQVECAMRSFAVVVLDVDVEDVLELAAAEDQQTIEAFAADGAEPALYVGVRVRRLDRRACDLEVAAREEGIKG